MAVDAVIASGAILAAGLDLAVPVVGVMAIAGLLLYQVGRRDLALALLVVGVSLLPQALLLAVRPPDRVQDSVALVDAASRRLAAGLDPYGHDYVDDPKLAAFWVPEWPVNPLLGHLVYPPGALGLGFLAHLLGVSVEWMWLPGTVALALAGRLAAGRLGVVATALNPAIVLDAFPFLNDLFFLAALLTALAMADRRRPIAAGIALSLALGLKQTAVVAAPLVIWLAWKRGGAPRMLAAAAVSGLLLLAPFLVWDAGAVIRDTASYFYGSGVDSFPIRGPGIPGTLLRLGVIPSRWASYPSVLVQLGLLVPVVISARWLLAGDSTPRRFLWAGLVAGAVFAGGRTLAPNYVTVVFVFVVLAGASALENGAPARTTVDGGQNRTVGEAGI